MFQSSATSLKSWKYFGCQHPRILNQGWQQKGYPKVQISRSPKYVDYILAIPSTGGYVEEGFPSAILQSDQNVLPQMASWEYHIITQHSEWSQSEWRECFASQLWLEMSATGANGTFSCLKTWLHAPTKREEKNPTEYGPTKRKGCSCCSFLFF